MTCTACRHYTPGMIRKRSAAPVGAIDPGADPPARLRSRRILREALAAVTRNARALLAPAALAAAACAVLEYRLRGWLPGGGPAVTTRSLLLSVLAAALFVAPLLTTAGRAFCRSGGVTVLRAQGLVLGAVLRVAGRSLLVCLPLIVLTVVEMSFLMAIGVGAGVGRQSSDLFVSVAIAAIPVLLVTYGAAAAFLTRYLLVLPAAAGGTRLALACSAALLRGNRWRLACLVALPALAAGAIHVVPLPMDDPPLAAAALVSGVADALGVAAIAFILAAAYHRLGPCPRA
jgi:hypothetical protein